jgi:cold shock CspA family protein/energy-coupling factor transporter ATP-binding protein EcfA2
MTTVDQAYVTFAVIRDDFNRNADSVISEEDVKIRLITRLVTECLGWEFSDIGAERKHDNGFSDYLIFSSNKNCMIIEAKRVGSVAISTTEKDVLKKFKLSGPALTGSRDGIAQAASYAQPKGVPVAILTDGLSWIVFKPTIPGEEYTDKQAFVFPSLNAIAANFSTFYELLSKDAFSKRLYNQIFDDLHNTRTLLSAPLVAAIPNSNIFRQNKSQLAFDLEPVFDNFFSRMTGEDDPDLASECFVESRESRIADHSLEKMTARVLGNIDREKNNLGSELSAYISGAVELDSGESIFIVGPTGSGKSTFLDRFFKQVLEADTREKCIHARINFLEASGKLDSALHWATERLITIFEREIYNSGSPTWDELRGLYFSDYKRQSEGVHAKLYERDKAAFQERFGEYMAAKVENDREGYLKRILSDIVHNRKKLPIIIADNTDEFAPQYKETVFQYIQSLRVHVSHCIVIFPITDKTAWSFTKSDIYTIYQSKSFFLPTPPPREVFRRRIAYLKDKLNQDEKSPGKHSFLTSRGITVSIKNLAGFANAVEETFVNDEFSAKLLGELSNYNIRRTLRLARRIITSPIYRIEDLIVAYTSGSPIHNRFTKFMNALLKGDHNFFNKNDSDASEIVPIFEVDHKFRQSPLLALRILALLDSTERAATDVESRHLSFESISGYFQAIGCSESAIDRTALLLIQSNLIEPFDPSQREITPAQKLAISYSGKAHLRLSLNNHVYFAQMALTTEISNQETALLISSCYNGSMPTEEKYANIRSLFANYIVGQDQLEISSKSTLAHYDCQRELLKNIGGYIQSSLQDRDSNTQMLAGIAADILHEGILATVDFFDQAKGFGFVVATEINERCYVGADAIKKSNLVSLNDGDDILCDIGQSIKGPIVLVIHDVQNKPAELSLVQCEIVGLRPDRQFGFVSVQGLHDDVLFHFSLLNNNQIADLRIGLRFEAEVRVNSKNGLQQVRKIQRFL